MSDTLMSDVLMSGKFVETQKFGGNSEIWWKFRNLVEIQKFGENSEIRRKFRNLVEILKFCGNSKIGGIGGGGGWGGGCPPFLLTSLL